MEKQTNATTKPELNKKPSQASFKRGGKKFLHKKVCNLCLQGVIHVDYKNVELLTRYIAPNGKILPRRITGTCAKHQRAITVAVKRARHVALMPYVQD